ncbi:MAG: hypothetical protein V4534_00140 [Myxococcota bacterium]
MPITPVSAGVQPLGQLAKAALNKVKPTGPGSHSFGQVLQKSKELNSAQNVSNLQNIDLQKTQKVPTAIKSLFNNWQKDQNSMQKIMNVAMSGQTFTPSQLIVLQQATYKVTFELETMSKLVEQASSSIKTTMQTQV